MEEKKIIVYSKNDCPNCNTVKWGLDAEGLKIDERNIDKDPKWKAEFDAYGYASAPLTIFPDGTKIPGFDHGKLSDAIMALKG